MRATQGQLNVGFSHSEGRGRLLDMVGLGCVGGTNRRDCGIRMVYISECYVVNEATRIDEVCE